MVKADKPDWVSHDGYPIWSIDAHPSGKRFATGGGDNKVKVWSLACVIDRSDTSPQLLCTMTNHIAAVNCVRWSPSGMYLASASDDKSIIIWEMKTQGGGQIFGVKERNVENWGVKCVMRGHEADVTDLCWSPDGTRVASCGVDNKVIIWNIMTSSIITKLSGHDGIVKGIAWDPIGRYLFSQSDDRSAIVWRMSDYKEDFRITKPFRKAPHNTFYKRPAWSPDGQFVVAAGGVKKGRFVAPIIPRGGKWQGDKDFVGHSLSVTCTKFSPRVFRKQGEGQFFCCAVASQDYLISIWLTKAYRPVVVFKNLFTQSVLDLTWTADGYVLLACSSDGTIAMIQFTREELGETLGQLEVDEMLRKQYGDSVKAASSQTLLEDPSLMALERESSQGLLQTSSNSVQNVIPAQPLPPLNKPQSETRLPSGKRRIVPQFLGQGVVSAAPAQFSQPVSSPPPTSATAQTSVTQVTTTSVSETVQKPTEAQSAAVTMAVVQETETVTVSSIDISAQPTEEENKEKTEADKTTEKKKEKKRKRPAEEEEEENRAKKKAKTGKSKRVEESEKSPPGKRTATRFVGPTLPAPAEQDAIVKQLLVFNDNGQPMDAFIEATSSEHEKEMITAVSYVVGRNNNEEKDVSNVRWRDIIKGRASLAAGNKNFAAVACRDHSLYVFSPAGRRLLPCIMLNSPAAYLEVNQTSHLMAICTDCSVNIWNIQQQALEMTGSVASLLSGTVTIESTQVSETGQCIASMSSGESFTYHSSMKTWVRIADKSFTTSLFNSIVEANRISPRGLLSRLQVAAQKKVRMLPTEMLHLDSRDQSAETLAHLENMMASAIALNSVGEFKEWLKAYVRKLSEDGNTLRLEELCHDLRGPIHKVYPAQTSARQAQSGEWNTTILGLDKRKLLKDLLPIMSANKSIQRLVVKYKEALDQIAKREAELSQVRTGSDKGTANGQTPVFGRRDDAALNSAFNREQRIRDPRQISPTKRIAPVTPSADGNNNNNNNSTEKDKEDALNESLVESSTAQEKPDEPVAAEEKMEDN